MNKKVSFEIEYFINEDKYCLRYKVGGVTQEAPRYESLDSALCGLGGYIRYNNFHQKEIKLNIKL